MCSMDTVCLLFCLADRHNLLTLRQKTLPLYWNGKQLEFFQWTKWVILWAASKCCAILSIMRYINRNSRAVIGDKCTSSINRWTPPPAPPHQGNAHTVCTSTKQLVETMWWKNGYAKVCLLLWTWINRSKLFVGIAIDPFHAQEAQQTCWVEKEKCESARQASISDGCFSWNYRDNYHIVNIAH